MNYKKTLLATGMAAALGVTMSSTAQAGVLATSILNISDFVISIDNGSDTIGTIVDVSDFSQVFASNNADNSASLNATTLNGSLTGQPGPVDLPQLCLGGNCIPFAENDFTTPAGAQSPPTSQYSYSDQQLGGFSITGLGGPPGAFANTRADVSLVNNATGSSTSNTGTGTAFQFQVGAGITGLDIDLNYNAFLEAFVDSTDQVPPSAADADISWTISIINLTGGGTLLNQSPDVINENVSLTFPLGSSVIYQDADSLHFDANGFNSVDVYQLTVTHSSEANATVQVSEPSTFSMALLGMGILGAGVAVRRRKN